MNKPGRQGDSSLNLDQLDRNEPSWQRAAIGFILIFLAVGVFYIFWILLFRLVSP
ncbi:MAG: hypothetical protein OXH11_11860 [Candidatus Aminicenantes bacterium]|nr:hypothetical protein [Candidatus Aminicenantes bacterium]